MNHQVRYPSDLTEGMALYDKYPTAQQAYAAAGRLTKSFRARGLRREANGVRVISPQKN